ncbi:zinc dependent phospholipase C family protein [Anaerosporobacter sp.]|uniref:zinc dependent phospholipase C family protein n=1 Tax=Anaerosporobacter sp. TaxID=1872529 RepID=UPI00286EC05A|nr:zinc dependent phospholipase C family protein [Anaerosporobacter sp.]
MPAIYAHYRFGCDVIKNTPHHITATIVEYRSLFDIGLHGPDLLFFYRPLFSNPVNRIGFGIHDKRGRVFFEQAAEMIHNLPRKEPALAYLYGSLCHFALDSMCHPYIEEKSVNDDISHTQIESSFDFALMQKDSFKPARHNICSYINPNINTAKIISQFYSSVKPKEILKAQQSLVSYNRFLYTANAIKRGAALSAFKLSGNYNDMKGMLLPKKTPSECIDSTNQLLHLYDFALIQAANLFGEMDAFLKDGRKLSSLFDHTYGAI